VNSQATKKVLMPEIREKLQKLYDGPKDGFEDFLKENFFDLHYEVHPDARPLSLGIGQMWRLATENPESKSLPCVHRAPLEKSGLHRLLLIC